MSAKANFQHQPHHYQQHQHPQSKQRGVSLWQYYNKHDDVDQHSYKTVQAGSFIVTYMAEATLAGVSQLIRSPGILKKFYWIVAIALCALGLQWELSAFFAKFLSWSATTSVSIETAHRLPFPAVTICNNNPVTTDWYQEKMGKNKDGGGGDGGEGGEPPSPPDTSDGGGGGGGSTLPPAPSMRKRRQVGDNLPTGGDGDSDTIVVGGQRREPPKRKNFASDLQETLRIQGEVSKIHYENRSIAGHQLCDMILKARYEGEEINPGEAFDTWHWNPTYGNCFTFNAGYKKANTTADSTEKNTWKVKKGGDDGAGILTSSLSGDTYGLYMLLHADLPHYLSWTTQVGWRIIIHNQTEMPLPEESGIFVAPGQSTSVGISMKYVERLGVVANPLYNAPYSDCYADENLEIDNVRNAYSNFMEVAYTKPTCMKTCYQQHVMENCGCFDFNVPDRGRAFDNYRDMENDDMRPCVYENQTEWQCKTTVADSLQDGTLECSCPNTCHSYSFDLQLSQRSWPNPTSPTLEGVCAALQDIFEMRSNDSDPTCIGRSYLPEQAIKSGQGRPKVAQQLGKCKHQQYTEELASSFEMADYLVGSQFAEVFVFYKDFNYQTVIESQWLEFADLLAYLGGILGLFFGFTFITLFEYIQLLIDIIVICVGRVCCSRNEVVGVKTNPNMKHGSYPASNVTSKLPPLPETA